MNQPITKSKLEPQWEAVNTERNSDGHLETMTEQLEIPAGRLG